MTFTISESRTEILVVTPRRMERQCGEDLARRVRQWLLVPRARVLVDLRGTEYMDFSCLGALVWLKDDLQERGTALLLLGPRGQVWRAFKKTMLDRVLDIIPDGPECEKRLAPLSLHDHRPLGPPNIRGINQACSCGEDLTGNDPEG